MSRTSKRAPLPAADGEVRIIGGRLRGSRLKFPALPGLRPSSDRMRETLFNWLMHETAGRACLDLFAGSGALGFEAASRGATPVLLIERDPAAAAALRTSAQRLGAALDVHLGDALAWLRQPPARGWQLVFIDPPFAAGVQASVIGLVDAHLAERAFVYVESAPGPAPVVPAHWQLHRELATRHAHGRLYLCDRARPESPLLHSGA
ncbi:16S rRNA (guanine(966)-N(2))-methyltransferase RsmD [Aquimonas voraii]|uniref:16S rRNA m(2)G-966 methyltransferase n=1 Tax=Aquimonas voraii TaxID=265719 RepID=A0A1G7A8B7_9GAMM|nr:16S rRNA (guanine(966)-N(2))-methyltransferase RsmD [Aquimonas voraii]SDE10126.1 16S rRNA m(2)G-966 methyltransferase [Aquimonas voraii]